MVARVGVPAVAVGTAAVARVAVPATAAGDAVLALFVKQCLPIGRSAFVVIVPRIFAPFPDISEHVVQAPGIGIFLGHRMGAGMTVLFLFLRPPGTVLPTFVVYAAIAAIPGNGVSSGPLFSPLMVNAPV